MKKTAAWLLCAVWMGVIYYLSAMPGDISDGQSDLVLGGILGLFDSDGPVTVLVDLMGPLFRKAAHMIEYAILFLLYRQALSLSGAKHAGIAALVMSACYAATDEWHQYFVADRASSVVDVGIDTLGAAAAWGLQELLRKIGKKLGKKLKIRVME